MPSFSGRYFGVCGFTPDVRLYAATSDHGRYVGVRARRRTPLFIP